MTRVTGVILGVLAVLASVLVVSPAQAAPKGTLRAVIIFEKNHQNQFRSTITWRLVEVRGSKRTVLEQQSWRAGSGLPGKAGRDACRRSVGWLPNGEYRLTLHHDYAGNVIKGRAFRIENKACGNGTVRQNLFLHTEQGAGSRQCADAKGDQACRWEFPRINDYKSNGCIKMAPGHLHELVRRFDRVLDAGIAYDTSRAVLIVR